MLEKDGILENETIVENEEASTIDNTIEKTEVIEETPEEILEEEVLAEEIELENEVKPSFVKEILIGVVDQIVSLVAALVILFVFNLIIKIFGYYVAEKEPMFLIMYVIVNIIYSPICNKLKLKQTVGRKILLNK